MLTANVDNATYRWLDCNNGFTVIEGETEQSFVVSRNGSYAAEVTLNGCTDTTECVDVTVLDIVENTFRGKVSVYPNPTRGTVKITLDRPYPQTQVMVRSVTGQVVQQQQMDYGKELILDINQPRGVYLVTVSSSTYRAVIRVVKQ